MEPATVPLALSPLLPSELAPPCRWRGGQLGPDRYICRSPKLNATRGVLLSRHCVGCYCRDHEPTKRVKPLKAAIRVPDTDTQGNRFTLDCIHRGDRVRKLFEGCNACWVYGCKVHKECIRFPVDDDAADELKVCLTCKDRNTEAKPKPDPIPPPPPTPCATLTGTRHLLYHLLPVQGNGIWQRAVVDLLRRLPLFNGIRVVAVMTPSDIPFRKKPRGVVPDPHRVPLVLDPPEDVEAAIAGRGVEVIRVPNDPNLREVASHGPLFERLHAVYQPGDVALWAHAKATTRHKGHVAERWGDVMAEAMLDYWPVVEDVLRNQPLAGCFKKHGPGWRPTDSKSDWHYSGSWFWFRCADLFAKDWRRIDQFWSGIEPYPSQHFHHSEAGLVFLEGRVPALNLYNDRYWKMTVERAWLVWKSANAGKRLAVTA